MIPTARHLRIGRKAKFLDWCSNKKDIQVKRVKMWYLHHMRWNHE